MRDENGPVVELMDILGEIQDSSKHLGNFLHADFGDEEVSPEMLCDACDARDKLGVLKVRLNLKRAAINAEKSEENYSRAQYEVARLTAELAGLVQ